MYDALFKRVLSTVWCIHILWQGLRSLWAACVSFAL